MIDDLLKLDVLQPYIDKTGKLPEVVVEAATILSNWLERAKSIGQKDFAQGRAVRNPKAFENVFDAIIFDCKPVAELVFDYYMKGYKEGMEVSL